MAEKEAKARIKINKLLEEAGWRFLDDENGKANIALESNWNTPAGLRMRLSKDPVMSGAP